MFGQFIFQWWPDVPGVPEEFRVVSWEWRGKVWTDVFLCESDLQFARQILEARPVDFASSRSTREMPHPATQELHGKHGKNMFKICWARQGHVSQRESLAGGIPSCWPQMFRDTLDGETWRRTRVSCIWTWWGQHTSSGLSSFSHHVPPILDKSSLIFFGSWICWREIYFWMTSTNQQDKITYLENWKNFWIVVWSRP